MTLLVEQETPTRGSAAPGHRGPRRIGFLLPALAVVLVLGYALLPQLVRLDQDVAPRVPVDAGLLVPEFSGGGVHLLHYRYGETVSVDVPLSNRGPVPITVDEVAPAQHRLPLLTPVSASGLPVTLAPREQTTVALTFRFTNCRFYHERSMETIAGVEVSGSSLGRDFTEPLTFAQPLAVHGQVILDCPERTLVRGDDVR